MAKKKVSGLPKTNIFSGLAVVFVLLQTVSPLVLPFFPSYNRTAVQTSKADQSPPLGIAFITNSRIDAGNTLTGNVTVNGVSLSGYYQAGRIYIGTIEQYNQWKAASFQGSLGTLWASDSDYIYYGSGKLIYPISVVINSTDLYYVYYAGQWGNTQPIPSIAEVKNDPFVSTIVGSMFGILSVVCIASAWWFRKSKAA